MAEEQYSLGLEYTGGILEPVPEQAGYLAFVNSAGRNLEYRDPNTPMVSPSEPGYAVPVFPQYVSKGVGNRVILLPALIEGETWRVVAQGYQRNSVTKVLLTIVEKVFYINRGVAGNTLIVKEATGVEEPLGSGLLTGSIVSQALQITLADALGRENVLRVEVLKEPF